MASGFCSSVLCGPRVFSCWHVVFGWWQMLVGVLILGLCLLFLFGLRFNSWFCSSAGRLACAQNERCISLLFGFFFVFLRPRQSQDFVLPLRAVTSMWRQGKITSETCCAVCLQVREVGVQRMIWFLEWYEVQPTRMQHEQLTARILAMEQQLCRPFRHHDKIDTWIGQYRVSAVYVRFKILLLQGVIRSGKT